MLHLDAFKVTDLCCPAGDEEAWQAQQDNRAAQLHRKLMSPDRHRRRTPLEIQRGMEAKLARAQHRREEMGSKMRRRMAQAEAGRQVGAWVCCLERKLGSHRLGKGTSVCSAAQRWYMAANCCASLKGCISPGKRRQALGYIGRRMGACCAAACLLCCVEGWKSALESVAPRCAVGSRDSLSMHRMRQPGGSPLYNFQLWFGHAVRLSPESGNSAQLRCQASSRPLRYCSKATSACRLCER